LYVARVGDSARPLELTGGPQLREQERVQPLPHACLLPRIEAAVAGRAGPKAELERQVPPRDPGMQHKQDPLQRRTIIEPPTTRVAEATLDPRQQRLDQPPQPIRHDPRRNSHRHPFQLDDGCRRRSSSGNGSLHSDSSSKRDLFTRIAQVTHNFVLGDVVVPEDPNDAAIEIDWEYDLPSSVADQLAWLQTAGFDANATYVRPDLAVFRCRLQ
jgi:hypothetical protein